VPDEAAGEDGEPDGLAPAAGEADEVPVLDGVFPVAEVVCRLPLDELGLDGLPDEGLPEEGVLLEELAFAWPPADELPVADTFCAPPDAALPEDTPLPDDPALEEPVVAELPEACGARKVNVDAALEAETPLAVDTVTGTIPAAVP
jgi:hypothetical protein